MSAPKYIPPRQAFEQVVGYRPSGPTLWRWSHRGSEGVLLQTWKIGGRRLTTVDAVQKFIDEKTAKTTPSKAPNPVEVSKELQAELS